MARIKYYYDTETCKYERIRVRKRDIAFNAFGFLSVVLVFATAIVVVLNRYFETPKTLAQAREIENLKQHIGYMDDEVAAMEQMMGVLQEKDDNVYRVVFEAEPIPETVREAGSGGALRYRSILESDLNNKELVVNTRSMIDRVKKKMYIQTKSYDEIMALAENKEALLAAIPAIQPVSNKELHRLSSGFGSRTDPVLKVKRFHYGTDFSAPKGTPVYATGDAKVSYAKKSFTGYGWHLILDHGFGHKTLYGHLSKFNVKKGQKVKRGDLIAYVGNTGKSTAPHLHYEVRVKGKAVDPVNYFYKDLNPEEYEEILCLSSIENQMLGSNY